MSELVLISISGQDRPGITHRLAGARHASGVIKDVLFAAYEMGLDADFKPVSGADYRSWVEDRVPGPAAFRVFVAAAAREVR